MSQDPNSETKNWWQTVPGVLTALAAVITALTGLVVALGGLGIFHHASTNSSTSTTLPPTSPTSTSSSTPVGTIALPLTSQVHSGTAVYQLLSLQTSAYSPGKLLLRVTVRMTNNGSADANFWSASFCVSVNGLLEAPNNLLDDLVPSNSSKEGTVEFIIPSDVTSVGLQMGDVGADKPTVPISLNSAAPKH